MWRSKRFLWAAALAGVTLLAGVSVVISQERQARRVDRAKNDVIEGPVRTVVQNSAGAGLAPKALDYSKSLVIEPAAKTLVASASAAAPPPPPPRPGADKFVNPKVQPGKVRWHASLDDARAASARSKKPVLLFQMMGKLDDQFC